MLIIFNIRFQAFKNLLLRTSSISRVSSVPLKTLNIKLELFKHGRRPTLITRFKKKYQKYTKDKNLLITLLAKSRSISNLSGA